MVIINKQATNAETKTDDRHTPRSLSTLARPYIKKFNLVKKRNTTLVADNFPVNYRRALRSKRKIFMATNKTMAALGRAEQGYKWPINCINSVTLAKMRTLYLANELFMDYDDEALKDIGFDFKMQSQRTFTREVSGMANAEAESMIVAMGMDPSEGWCWEMLGLQPPKSEEEIQVFRDKGERFYLTAVSLLTRKYGNYERAKRALLAKEDDHLPRSYNFSDHMVVDMLNQNPIYECASCGQLNHVHFMEPKQEDVDKIKNRTVSVPDAQYEYFMENLGKDSSFMVPKSVVHLFDWKDQLPIAYPDNMNYQNKGDTGYQQNAICCGFCSCSLHFHTVLRDTFKHTIEKEIDLAKHYVAGLKDQLLLQGYGDVLDDADAQSANKLIQFDLAMVKKIMSSVSLRAIRAPSNLQRSDTALLNKEFPQYVMRSRSLPGIINPLLYMELKLSQVWIADKEDRDILVINSSVCNDSFISEEKDDGINYLNLHGWQTKSTKPHRTKSDEVPVIGERLVEKSKLINLLTKTRKAYVILLNADRLTCHQDGNDLLMFTPGKCDPIMVNSATHQLLTRNTAIHCNNVMIMNYTVKTLKHVSINLLVVTDGVRLVNKEVNIIDTIDITMPLPDVNSDWGTIPILNLQQKNFKLRVKLMRALCVANITGDKSESVLREYAVAFCNTTYRLSNRTIHNKDITFDEIGIHVILCRAMMSTSNALASMSLSFNEISRYVKPLMPIITTGVVNASNIAFNYIVQMLESLIGQENLEKVMKLLKGLNLSSLIDNHINNEIWEQLSNLKEQFQTRVIRVESHAAKPLILHYATCCEHHSANCNHASAGTNNCECCGISCINILCDCCSVTKLAYTNVQYSFDKKIKKILKESVSKSKTVKEILKETRKSVKLSSWVTSTIENLMSKTQDGEPLVPQTTERISELREIKSQSYKEMLINGVDVTALPAELSEGFGDLYLQSLIDYRSVVDEVNDTPSMYLPYLPYGEFTLRCFSVADTIDQTNVEPATCGFRVLEELFADLPFSLDQMRRLTNRNNWFYVEDLGLMCRRFKMNLIVARDNDPLASVFHYNAVSEMYKCVELQTRIEVVDNIEVMRGSHFRQAILALESKPDIILVPSPTISVQDLTSYCRAQGTAEPGHVMYNDPKIAIRVVSAIMLLTAQHVSRTGTLGTVIVESGHSIWRYPNNNLKHHVNKGKIYTKVRTNCIAVLEDNLTRLTESMDQPTSHRDRGVPTNIEMDFNEQMKSEWFNIRSIRSYAGNEARNDINAFEKKLTDFRDGKWWINSMHGGIKTFDTVLIRFIDENNVSVMYNAFVEAISRPTYESGDLIGTRSIMVTLPECADEVKIATFKVSTGSSVRKIIALSQECPTTDSVVELLSNSECVEGPAGCGKTTFMCSHVQDGAIMIAMTGGAKSRLAQMVTSSKIKIMSVEKYMNSEVSSELLFIDEATMLDYTVVAIAARKGTRKIIAAGDRNQVGYVDMRADAGIRMTSNVLDLISMYGGTVDKRNYSYRMPIELLNVVNQLDIGAEPIECRSEEHGTYEFVKSPDLSGMLDVIKDLVPEAILTPYKHNLREIKKLIKLWNNTTSLGYYPECGTIHSCQGREWSRVLVVLKATANGSWGLNGDSRYLMSACTRAKSDLRVLVVNRESVEDLMQCISVRAGSNDLYEFISCNGIRYSSQLISWNASQQGATASLERTSDGSYLMRTSRLGRKADIIIAPDGVSVNIDRSLHSIAVSKLREFTESLPKLKAKFDRLHQVDATKIGVFKSRHALTKIRILAWLAESSGCLQTKFELPGKNVLWLRKGTGCPYWCELMISLNDGNLLVEAQYDTLYYRKFRLNLSKSSAKLYSWLTSDNEDNVLGKIPVPPSLNSKMMFERVTTFVDEFKTDDGVQWKPACQRLRADYADKMLHDFPQLQSIDPNLINECKTMCGEYPLFRNKHNFVITPATKKKFLIGRKMQLLTMVWGTSSQIINTTNINELNYLWKAVANDILLNTGMRSENDLVGGVDSDLNQLNIPIQEHLDRNTVVGTYIKKSKTRIRLLNSFTNSDVIWTGATSSWVTNRLLLENPNLIVKSFKSISVSMPAIEVLEAICTCTVGRNNPRDYVYAGYYPHVITSNNQHYAKLLQAVDHTACSHKCWHESLPHVESSLKIWEQSTKGSCSTTVSNMTTTLSQVQPGDSINYGMRLGSISNEELLASYKATVNVYGMIMLNCNTANTELINNTQLAYTGCNMTVSYSELLADNIKCGRPFKLRNEWFTWSILANVADHVIVKLVPVPTGKNIIYSLISDTMHVPDMVEVNAPWLNFNVLQLIGDKSLIETKRCMISRRIFRHLMMRLSLKGANTKTALAYARSLISAELTTQSYIGVTDNIDPIVLVDTTRVAVYVQTGIFRQLYYYSQVLNHCIEGNLGVLATQIVSLLNQVSKGLELAVKLMHLDTIMHNIEHYLGKEMPNLLKGMKSLQDCSVLLNYQKEKIIKYDLRAPTTLKGKKRGRVVRKSVGRIPSLSNAKRRYEHSTYDTNDGNLPDTGEKNQLHDDKRYAPSADTGKGYKKSRSKLKRILTIEDDSNYYADAHSQYGTPDPNTTLTDYTTRLPARNYNLILSNPILEHKCDYCPKVSNDWLHQWSYSNFQLFNELVSIIMSHDWNYTVVKGTLLAALRYGSIAYSEMINGHNYMNWVDTDYDVLIYIDAEETEEINPNIIFQNIAKELGCRNFQRSDFVSCITKYEGPTLDFSQLPEDKVWTELRHTDWKFNQLAVDIGLIIYEGDTYIVEDRDLAIQMGIKRSVPFEINIIDFLPRIEEFVLLEELVVPIPNYWPMHLEYLLTDMYDDESYSKLILPYIAGSQTGSLSWCGNYEYKIDGIRFVIARVANHLRALGSRTVFDVQDKAKLMLKQMAKLDSASILESAENVTLNAALARFNTNHPTTPLRVLSLSDPDLKLRELESRPSSRGNILFITVGSAGDVQPMKYIANIFYNNNYDISFKTHYDHFNSIPKGYSFYPITCSITNQFKAVIDLYGYDAKVTDSVTDVDDYLTILLYTLSQVTPKNEYDLIIAGALTPGIELLEECMGVRTLWLRPYPWLHVNTLFSPSLMPLNKVVNVIAARVLYKKTKKLMFVTNPSRALGLEDIPDGRNIRSDQLICFNVTLLPEEARSSYDGMVHLGSLSYISHYIGKNDGKLTEFLRRPERKPVVLISYGSIPLPTVLEVSIMLSQAVLLVGFDCVINVPGAKQALSTNPVYGNTVEGVCKDNSKVYLSTGFPYNKFLKEFCLVLNHGGAGMFDSCIKAAVPLVVTPIIGDQAFWGHCLEQWNIGLRLKIFSDITEEYINERFHFIKRHIETWKTNINELHDKDLETIFTDVKTEVCNRMGWKLHNKIKSCNVENRIISSILTREQTAKQWLVNMHVKSGTYATVVKNASIIYNNNSRVFCGRDSVKYATGVEDLLQCQDPIVPALECVMECFRQGYNVHLFSSSMTDEGSLLYHLGKLYVLLEGAPIIHLTYTVEESKMNHMMVADCDYDISDAIPLISSIGSDETIMCPSCHLLASINKAGIKTNDYLDWQNIMAKLKLNQLDREWKHRYTILILSEMKTYESYFLSYLDYEMTNNLNHSLCWVWTNQSVMLGWISMHCELDSGTTTLRFDTFDPIPDGVYLEGTVMVLNARVLKENAVEKTVRVARSVTLKSNFTLSKHDQRHFSSKGIMTVQFRRDAPGKLYIRNFDNRSHHGSTRAVDVITGVENGDLELMNAIMRRNFEEFRVSTNNALNRAVMHNGRFLFTTEFGSKFYAIAESRHIECDNLDTNIHSEHKLELGNMYFNYDVTVSSSGAKMLTISAQQSMSGSDFRGCGDMMDHIRNMEFKLVKDVTDLNPSAVTKARLRAGEQGWHVWSIRGKAILAIKKKVGIYKAKINAGDDELFNLITVDTEYNAESKAQSDVMIESPMSGDISSNITTGKIADIPNRGEQSKHSEHRSHDWFHLHEKEITTLDPAMCERVHVDHFSNLKLITQETGITNQMGTADSAELMQSMALGPYPDVLTVRLKQGDVEFLEEHTLTSLLFWDDVDLTDNLVKYGPLTSGKLKSNETAIKQATFIKYTMVAKPIITRPVITKLVFKEHNTITGRLMSVLNVRKENPRPRVVLNDMASAYFRDDYMELAQSMRNNPITFDKQATLDWISKHHKANDILAQLVTVLEETTLINNISDINIHLKLESLFKPNKVVSTYREQQPRSIMWQNYYVAAIYSPIFMKVKDRLKAILKPNVIYADGYTPEQLNYKLSEIDCGEWFVDDDLSKQDRQTDDPIIEVEMRLYELLGCSIDVLNNWKIMHKKWRFKSTYSRGVCESMRLTGQSTTAVGNFITNMQVHADFIKRNQQIILAIVFLGDDIAICFKNKPNVKLLPKHIATRFNMHAKTRCLRGGAQFCSMILYPTHLGTLGIGPDYIKMRNKFEIPNGVSEITDEDVRKARAMSYLSMLGATPEVVQTIKNYNYPIKPVAWYNQHDLVLGLQHVHKISQAEVINNYNALINMLNDLSYHVHEVVGFKAGKW